ncbi:MAG: toxin TcdB middle/N-terminal domain-containing protein, partial [Myxococcota bacterium]
VENNLELADMNGDGLLDVVQMQVGALRYRLNYGRGLWGEWVNISGLSLTSLEIENAQLQDLNGDSLDDIVVVLGTEVSIALNDNSAGFDPLLTYTSSDVDRGSIPERTATTTVLFADMNGNGSTDVVWIEASGQVTALELFPLRPNLMTRYTNGIGAVTEITYETAAQQMARDGGRDAWPYALPFPMNVVSKLDQYDLLTNLHEVTTYRYHAGFYDGQEKQFRGFARVQTVQEGN